MNYYMVVEPPEIPCIASWTGPERVCWLETRHGQEGPGRQHSMG